MGKKMYYTEEEAAQRLGISAAELSGYVRDGKLRVFPDGMKKMYRVDQIDELAGGAGGDEVSLAESEVTELKPKEDTVISSEGISIFDAEDLEIETADPMAKTQIVSSIEDQINLEGVGSGSGLLDLTRESDDTSLGAEVLDNIEIEGAGAGAPAQVMAGTGTMAPAAIAPVEQVMVSPTYVEEIDPMAGLFGGIVVAAALLGGILLVAAMGSFGSTPPSYLASIKENMTLVLIVGVVVSAICGALGFLAGKASSARAAALRQSGF
jgi:hypothetical protein